VGRDRILVVDDQAMNLDLLVGILEPDYEVSAALTGEEALDLVPRLAPDLVLLDVRLPGIDGFEVCRRLKTEPGWGDPGVIFLTALNDDDDQGRGLELGAADFITKPFNPSLVKARIRNYLSLVHASREVARQRDQLGVQLRQLEEAQKLLVETEKQVVLGQMITGVAHELNTPLGTAVTGISFLLEKTRTPEEGQMLQLVLGSLRRAHDLIEKLKQASAATGGTGPLTFDLATLVRTQVGLTLSEGGGAAIVPSFDGPLELRVTSYPDLLGRVLEALVRNSLDHAFTPGSPGRVSVGWSVANGVVSVVYGDDGKGLDPSELGHLFEPFRGSLLRKERPGLGTFLARHLVISGLGGTLKVTCPPGQGLRYELSFPDRTNAENTASNSVLR
jgi:DNA-binding response OmpR family regulator